MTDTKGKIEGIPPNAIITIEVGGGLYTRIHQIMWAKAAERPAEKFQESLEHLKSGGKARDTYEYEIETYLSLLYEIEKAAADQKKTVLMDPSDLKISSPFRA